MRLLILNGPRDPIRAQQRSYRGTYRAHPSYCDRVSKDHEINKMFFWFLEEGGELGIVHDLAKAVRYVELLNTHRLDFSPPYTRFEVIQVTEFGQPALPAGTLLGFDLSAGYNNSLLSQGLEPSTGVKILAESIQQLISLLDRFYAPHLNQHGLFQTPEIASDCLQSMDALQRLCPNLFEGVELRTNFRPVGVYLQSEA